MTPADRLRTAREAAGHRSASAAAKHLGIGASTYAAHENGQNAFTVEQAEIYGQHFNVSPAWLFFGETARTAPAMISLVRMLEQKGILTNAEVRKVFEDALLVSDKAGQ